MSGASKGRVILYMPHYVSPRLWTPSPDYMATPPLPYLSMGRPLREAGYEVRIIDAKWEPRSRQEIAETARGAAAVGVSGMTGYSVEDGLEVSALVKQVAPEVPVIWGGWHTSFVARQAAADPSIDVVVKGQGERALVEVLDALRGGHSLSAIRGIAYKDGRAVVETPDRAPIDINDLPPFDYGLVDTTRYVRVGPGAVRHANIIFSRGCPYQCDFCLDSRQKWFGLSLERMQAELEFWVTGHHVNSVRFYDGNFFMGRERLQAIADLINHGPLAGKFSWTATGVAKRLLMLDGQTLDSLRRSGCEVVAIGAESGSDELLRQITNKTTVAETTEAVRLLTRHGISQYLFFMVGYPDEPEGTLEKTLALVAKLKAINPRLELQLNFCMPLPGSEMFRAAIRKGLFTEPATFADWGKLDVSHGNIRSVDAAYENKVRSFLDYLLLAYPARYQRYSMIGRLTGSPLGRWLYAPVRRTALWRVERQAFGFPVEAALYRSLRMWRARSLRPRRTTTQYGESTPLTSRAAS